jgi:hypothetical protein
LHNYLIMPPKINTKKNQLQKTEEEEKSQLTEPIPQQAKEDLDKKVKNLDETEDKESEEGESEYSSIISSEDDVESPTKLPKEKKEVDPIRQILKEKRQLGKKTNLFGECLGETLVAACTGIIVLIGVLIAMMLRPYYDSVMGGASGGQEG